MVTPSAVISGIEKVANEAGYNLVISQSLESEKKENVNIRTMFNSRVDGMLISVSRETNNFDHIDNILAKGVPMVFFDRVYDTPNSSNTFL